MNHEDAQEVVGVAWYSPQAWAQLRRVVPDPDTLEPTYEAWCAVFEKGVRTLAQGRILAVCVPIDVDGLVAWCAEQHESFASGARAGYAAELLRRQHAVPRSKRGA